MVKLSPELHADVLEEDESMGRLRKLHEEVMEKIDDFADQTVSNSHGTCSRSMVCNSGLYRKRKKSLGKV
jgi:hypothetical protein